MDVEWLNLPDASYLARVAGRLGLAALLGALIGVEREVQGKAAGLRTHTMVSLSAAAFVLVGIETNPNNIGAVIQGIATGVGFLGAGTILKKKEEEGIFGLTTAATIWLTAAVGVATGAGHGFMALFCVIVAWLILSILSRLDRYLNSPEDQGTGN
ncbi:MAG: MgtC/SapB family protein [Cyanobacteria bacterium]|nr:MgtC/SapB family protein [Cyanobacteriota bacterium]